MARVDARRAAIVVTMPSRPAGELIAVELAARYIGVDLGELHDAIAAGELAGWQVGQRVTVDRAAIHDRFGVALPPAIVRPLRQQQPNQLRRPFTVSALVTRSEGVAISEYLERRSLGRRGGRIRSVLLAAASDDSVVLHPPKASGPTHAVTCSMSPTERAAIDAAAVRAGLSRSSWLRAVLLAELDAH